MEDKILDSPTLVDKHKKQSSLIIPLIILWVGIIWSYSVQESIFLIASVLTLASTILFFINKNATFYLIVSIFLLGVIKVIYIFPVQMLFGILAIELDVFCLVSLVTVLLLNQRRLRNLFHAFRVSEEAAQSIKVSKVGVFKKRFSRKSDEELKNIIRDKSIVEEAKIAAREILSSRT